MTGKIYCYIKIMNKLYAIKTLTLQENVKQLNKIH